MDSLENTTAKLNSHGATNRPRQSRQRFTSGSLRGTLMKYIFVLMVFVVDDGQWREWNSYPTLDTCEEVVKIITNHREDKIRAYCLAKQIE